MWRGYGVSSRQGGNTLREKAEPKKKQGSITTFKESFDGEDGRFRQTDSITTFDLDILDLLLSV